MMTKVRGAISGTHPMGEELIQSILDFKYGRAGKEPVKKLFQKELEELINLQDQLGFPLVSTGSFGIEDLIRPFTRSLNSLKSYEALGDLPINRWHFTNTFYRQPSLVSEFPTNSSVVMADTHTLSDENTYSHSFVEKKKAKIILPGPLSFAYLIDTEQQSTYKDNEELIIALGKYLAREIASLPEQYVEIQLDEPVLVWDRIPRTLRPAVIAAYDEISKHRKNRDLLVHTYFETAENILSFLLDLPLQGIGIDFTETNLLALSEYSFDKKILQAGLIDPQNYVPAKDGSLDDSDTGFLSDLAKTLLNLSPSELVITSTTGLEYLPREIADQRLSQINKIASSLKEDA